MVAPDVISQIPPNLIKEEQHPDDRANQLRAADAA